MTDELCPKCNHAVEKHHFRYQFCHDTPECECEMSQIDIYRTQRAALAVELDAVKIELKHAETMRDEWRQAAEQFIKKMDALRAELDAAKKELAEYVVEFENCNAAGNAAQHELDAARAEAEDYRKVLTDFANKNNWLWSDPFGHQPYWLLNADYASSSAVLAKYKKDGDA